MHNVDYKVIGKRIANQRKARGLTQWQLEEKADLSFKYLSNIERATSGLTIDVLLRLCDALGTTPDCILLGTTEKSDDISAAIESRLSCMNTKQLKLALSLMDWILAEKLD